jgi:cobyrinic acid a,c-diamide synthase
MSGGFLIAAPNSGSGKTVLTLGIMRALANAGVAVAPFKAGPDFIDPAFHAQATGRACYNLDPWGMRPALIRQLAGQDGLTVVEGMMGLFDGAADGSGSCADLAAMLDLPVVLVVDCARQSHSVAALVRGFRDHRSDIKIGGLILNRVATPRHETLLRDALSVLDIPILGIVPPSPELHLPERHLGLVQAGEHEALEAFVAGAARIATSHIDIAALALFGGHKSPENSVQAVAIAPLGQRIAVAQDRAFAFAYPHIIAGWRQAGATISFFSPLNDEAPNIDADAIYLPGGYPELHGETLAKALKFKRAMRDAAQRGRVIYGECGGFMVLGETLVDGEGVAHEMLGLLSVETSFAKRQRHLGYRQLTGTKNGLFSGHYRGHEFHYSTLIRQGVGNALFTARDANGSDLGSYGLQIGSVAGSYLHLIDTTETN